MAGSIGKSSKLENPLAGEHGRKGGDIFESILVTFGTLSGSIFVAFPVIFASVSASAALQCPESEFLYNQNSKCSRKK